jgi:hypothetical protein
MSQDPEFSRSTTDVSSRQVKEVGQVLAQSARAFTTPTVSFLSCFGSVSGSFWSEKPGLQHATRKEKALTTPTEKPSEFAASGASPPALPAYPDHLIEELAQILADALHEDIKQYPNVSDIPPVTEPTVVSRRGSDRKSRPRSRSKARKAASQSRSPA